VLLGGTGSGKSALLQASVGILRRSSGSMKVLGLDPNDRSAACRIRSQCGFVPQDKSLYGNFTVREMCHFSRSMYPGWKQHLEQRLLDRFDLDPHRLVRDLSPNRRALLSMALALIHQPEILLLDEPFDDLDPAAARNLLQALIEASGEGASVVLATNNPERVEDVADRAIFFQNGQVAISTTVEEIHCHWRRITAHFGEEAVLPSLPVPGIESVRGEGKMAEWVVSRNAMEVVSILQSLGAVSVRVDPLSMNSLFSRLPK
jgi:ABC-2 type transport system ATP-binding protein